MPVLTQLNLNIGTEQNPNMVLHDLHDIRISSTDVTTVTRLLGCDAGVNSIAPITLANAASLLGDYSGCKRISYSLTANEEKDITIYRGAGLLIIGSASAPNASFYTVPFWNQSLEGQELPLAFGSRQAYTPKITVKECRSATQVILTFKNLNNVAYNGTFILLYTR